MPGGNVPPGQRHACRFHAWTFQKDAHETQRRIGSKRTRLDTYLCTFFNVNLKNGSGRSLRDDFRHLHGQSGKEKRGTGADAYQLSEENQEKLEDHTSACTVRYTVEAIPHPA